jgi:hypothetical protein
MKIEKGIPIPDRMRRPYKKRSVFIDNELNVTLSKLRAGDSFVITEDRRRCNCYLRAVKLKITITTRKINGEGWRIWRTA